jgi:Effector-associated domain 1/Trypsin-like peptidase domain
MPLSGKQIKQLRDALADAFRYPEEFETMLHLGLNKRLNAYAADNLIYPDKIYRVIDKADAQDWIEELVRAALEANPRNSELRRFYENAWFSLNAPEKSRLEVLIRNGKEPLDPGPWAEKFEKIGRQVCCIEINLGAGRPPAVGTGILVADDLVLTNYHVMEPVILGEQGHRRGKEKGLAANIGDVRFRFDYRLLPDGSSCQPETLHYLTPSEKWLVHFSVPSLSDLRTPNDDEYPKEDELDYALVRLSKPAAKDPGPYGSGSRDFVPLPAAPDDVKKDDSLLILQHPWGEPLKFDFHVVTKCNFNHTRIQYRLETREGSSGSPCFNNRLDLVALHHGGYGEQTRAMPNAFNEGIPMKAIRQLLDEQEVQIA